MVNTIYEKKAIDESYASTLYEILSSTVSWEEGIKSRKNTFTRKQSFVDLNKQENYYILECIVKTMKHFNLFNYAIAGVYLNYYENGNHYTPSHSHKGTCQLVISLGATRTLTISKKSYAMNNGDAIFFGSSIHSVPKEPEVKEGRISIAVFLIKIN